MLAHDNQEGVEEEEESENDSNYEPEYEIETIVVTKDLILKVLSVIPPPLEYLSSLHDDHKEISGRQVWTGSLFLAQVLCRLVVLEKSQVEKKTNALLDGKRILELGSGTGVLGMSVCRISNPLCVILTDGDPKAVDLLQQNLRNNQLIMTTLSDGGPQDNDDDNNKSNKQRDEDLGCRVRAMRLQWGNVDSAAEFVNNCRRCFQEDDQQQPHNKKLSFDCILAGDVLYKAELPRLFFETARSFLSETGTLWLCHVPRANVTQEKVVAAANEAGFLVEEERVSSSNRILGDGVLVSEEGVGSGCPLEDLERAQIYRMSLRTTEVLGR